MISTSPHLAYGAVHLCATNFVQWPSWLTKFLTWKCTKVKIWPADGANGGGIVILGPNKYCPLACKPDFGLFVIISGKKIWYFEVKTTQMMLPFWHQLPPNQYSWPNQRPASKISPSVLPQIKIPLVEMFPLSIWTFLQEENNSVLFLSVGNHLHKVGGA